MFYGRRAHVIMHSFDRIQGYTEQNPKPKRTEMLEWKWQKIIFIYDNRRLFRDRNEQHFH